MASSDVDRLFGEYVAADRRGGEADPTNCLGRVQGTDRAELAALIDGFLERLPRQSFDPAAFRGSRAETLVQSLDASLRGQAGLWPALLPRLRGDAQLRRSDLVERLAAALEAPDQCEKIGRYYHQMEQGQLSPDGISDRVLEALARIVSVSVSGLRRAGNAIAPTSPGAGSSAVFARASRNNEPTVVAQAAAAPVVETWDEVDRMFRGGPSA